MKDEIDRRPHSHLEDPNSFNPSTHTRPPPGRRRSRLTALTTLHLVLCSIVLLSTLCGPVSASSQHHERRKPRYGKVAVPLAKFDYVEPDYDLFQPGDIVYDRRFPVEPVQRDIVRRQDGVNVEDSSSKEGAAKTTSRKQLKFSSTSTASPAAATSSSSTLPDVKSSSSTSGAAAPSSIVTAPGADTSSLPRPFDTGLGNNYTQPNCPVFINNFLRNTTFTSCVPFSLLLQNSMSFFSATKSLSAITKTLTATCNVNETACSALLTQSASELRKPENCADDYRRQQPLVVSAYNALVAYEPLYRAGCERDEQGSYCFANAITNLTSPTDSYPYYLPLGIALPGGSQPTCSKCLKDTMAIFNEAANSKAQQQPLMTTYGSAAQLINVGCGPNFTNPSVSSGKSAGQNSGAPHKLPSMVSLAMTTLVAMLAAAGLLL
ncbi:MAG: hypothetical protein LQ352_008217 [Teloschistes flavicans]|nr:MAG: hypothetical protein LQ352_008217 [Teloschistes flavicans]